MADIMELNADEIESVAGGFWPVILAVGFIISAGAGGYMVGKDMATRDNAAGGGGG